MRRLPKKAWGPEWAALEQQQQQRAGVDLPATKRASTRQRTQFRTILDSIKTCDARCKADEQALELDFRGARLATLNQLLGRDGRDLRLYARAWHEALRRAICGQHPLPRFNAAELNVLRIGPRVVDPDNIVAKALVDGVRREGILPEDTPEHVVRFGTQQELGEYRVILRIWEV